MDDPLKHDLDDQDMNELDSDEGDEGDETPADTDQSDEPKTPGQQAMERQEKAWREAIKSGKKTLDDMPPNLKWLRAKLEPDTKVSKKPNVEQDELDQRVAQALQREREREEADFLIQDVAENATDEEGALFQEKYEELLSDGISQLKAVKYAREMVGLKDNAEFVKARKLKGGALPPKTNLNRTVVEKDKLTTQERKYMNSLPKGFRAN